MTLSEIFLETANRLSTDKNMGMCLQLRDVLHQNITGKMTDDQLYDDAMKILMMFRPHENTECGYYWFTQYKDGNDFRHVVKKISEAQEYRKDILLWCATIAESEGL